MTAIRVSCSRKSSLLHTKYAALWLKFTVLSTLQNIRLFATNHLGELIRQSPCANAWTLRLLLTQLYDTSMDVCEMSVHFLEEVCESMEILQLVVEMRPTVDHLGEIGHPLLLKYVYKYIIESGTNDKLSDSCRQQWVSGTSSMPAT